MAERHRAGLAAVLAADAHLQVLLHAAPALDRDPHQVADALLVDNLERVPLEDARLEVAREELALGVVPREAERRLGEVVRPERAEVRLARNLVGTDTGARQLDHRPDVVVKLPLLRGDRDRQLAQPAELLLERDQRVHDLDERRVARPLPHRDRRPDDRADLHLVDLRMEQPEPAAARAEHRVRLPELLDPLAHPVIGRVLEVGEELVQRRVEEADRHRQPSHRLEDPLEVGLLHRQEPLEHRPPLVLGRGHDHLADDRQPVLGIEHVLGPAKADPLRAELACLRGVVGRVGVRAHPQAPHVVGPRQDRQEVVVHLRWNELDVAEDDPAGRAVDRDLVALADRVLAELRDRRSRLDREPVAARDARASPSPRATTAACEVRPPWAVRIPAAWRIP